MTGALWYRCTRIRTVPVSTRIRYQGSPPPRSDKIRQEFEDPGFHMLASFAFTVIDFSHSRPSETAG